MPESVHLNRYLVPTKPYLIIMVIIFCRRRFAPRPPVGVQSQTNEFSRLFLSDLSIFATLGIGGFGRVELVSSGTLGIVFTSELCIGSITALISSLFFPGTN